MGLTLNDAIPEELRANSHFSSAGPVAGGSGNPKNRSPIAIDAGEFLDSAPADLGSFGDPPKRSAIFSRDKNAR